MIKDVLDPPICSECGTALVYPQYQKQHKNSNFHGWYGYEPDLRKCTNSKCGMVTDISLRKLSDQLHAIYEEEGKDPHGGTFNYETHKWESEKKNGV